MPLLPLVGHVEVRQRVAGALSRGRFPQTILISGPPGVGKQRFALWAAQRLVCDQGKGRKGEKATTALEPCGACPSCRKVQALAHPDVHWVVPIPRPKAGDPEKQVEEVEQALAEVMAERREKPLWISPGGMAIHGVASARLILRRAALTPVETGPKVFIVGEAERLVPQESSPEAANALLKVIEEPPNDTVFLLTSAEQARMLPTIRSRAVPLRLGRLSDDEVRGFLAEHLEPALDAKTLEHRVRAAQGSIGRALEEDASAARAREAASAFLALIEEGGGRWLEPVMRQATWQARGEFSGMLEALGEILSEKARTGGPTGGWTGERNDRQLVALVRAMERVQETLEQAQGNVNPQLLLSVLAEDLEEALCG